MKQDPKRRLEELDAIVTALAHPARRQMLLTVYFWGGEMTAGEIAARFGHAWPTTTRHLRVLTDARLLSVGSDGRRRIYRLNRTRLNVLSEWLRHFDRRAPRAVADRAG